MSKFRGSQLWMCSLLLAGVWANSAMADSDTSGRKLNPYHEQQLNDQIRKCASGVLACSDTETRCAKQQELCQLLIRTERYDEAMQVANNVYKTDNANEERKAAHHYLVAEIYNRKMRSSRNLTEMEKNRQYALSAAQEVVDRKYPSKWGVSEHARDLIRELSNSREMSGVRQRVASRQGSQGDSAKEAIAEAQRKYLDSTQGRGTRTVSPVSPRDNAQFTRVSSAPKVEETYASAGGGAMPISSGGLQTSSLPNQPSVTHTFSPVRTDDAVEMQPGDRLANSGLLTSQPGLSPAATTVASQSPGPLMVNGQVANNTASADEIAKNNLAQLLEAARKRKESSPRSTYATGEGPTSIRR